MLINFKIGNFRSFNEQQIFSMKATGIHEHKDSLIEKKIGNKTNKLLPLSIVYGANAAGKTNIFKGLDLIRNMILRGNIDIEFAFYEKIKFEIFEFAHSEDKKPVSFEIEFIVDDKLIIYQLDIKIDEKDKCTIDKEVLIVNGINLYNRDETSIKINKDKKAIQYFDEKNEAHLELNEEQLNKNIDPKKLFLTGVFRDLIATDLIVEIMDWLYNLNVIFSMDRITSIPYSDSETYEMPKLMKKFLEKANIGPQEFFYKKEDENKIKLKAIYEYKKRGEKSIDASLTESTGTIKLIDFLPLLFGTLQRGGILLVDELDASIHSIIIASIVTWFRNPDVNKRGAQFIFSTHNPIYLKKQFIRRDEIKFVDKNDKYESEIYSLSDYCRNDSNYIKNYINGEYSAIPNIDDITDIIGSELWDEQKEKEQEDI